MPGTSPASSGIGDGLARPDRGPGQARRQRRRSPGSPLRSVPAGATKKDRCGFSTQFVSGNSLIPAVVGRDLRALAIILDGASAPIRDLPRQGQRRREAPAHPAGVRGDDRGAGSGLAGARRPYQRIAPVSITPCSTGPPPASRRTASRLNAKPPPPAGANLQPARNRVAAQLVVIHNVLAAQLYPEDPLPHQNLHIVHNPVRRATV